VLDLRLDPAVVEAGGEPRHQADRAIGRAEQQRPGVRGDLTVIAGVRGDLTVIECGHDLAAFDHFITEQVAVTLCRHRGAPPEPMQARLAEKLFADSEPRCTYSL
jgi:hypothetical protein